MCTHGLSIALRILICQSWGIVKARPIPVSIFQVSFCNFFMISVIIYTVSHQNFSAFEKETLYLRFPLYSM